MFGSTYLMTKECVGGRGEGVSGVAGKGLWKTAQNDLDGGTAFDRMIGLPVY